MKKFLGIFSIALIAAGNTFAQAKFKFHDKDDTYNFGNLKEGQKAEHEFVFTNVGNQPLIIQKVNASCGCTTPVWPKAPILPGKSASIKVAYNTHGNVGPINKMVYIKSNASTKPFSLRILGTVKE